MNLQKIISIIKNCKNYIDEEQKKKNFSFDETFIKFKSMEEKRISEKKEKYNNIEKLLNENDNIFCSYEKLKEIINNNKTLHFLNLHNHIFF